MYWYLLDMDTFWPMTLFNCHVMQQLFSECWPSWSLRNKPLGKELLAVRITWLFKQSSILICLYIFQAALKMTSVGVLAPIPPLTEIPPVCIYFNVSSTIRVKFWSKANFDLQSFLSKQNTWIFYLWILNISYESVSFSSNFKVI